MLGKPNTGSHTNNTVKIKRSIHKFREETCVAIILRVRGQSDDQLLIVLRYLEKYIKLIVYSFL